MKKQAKLYRYHIICLLLASTPVLGFAQDAPPPPKLAAPTMTPDPATSKNIQGKGPSVVERKFRISATEAARREALALLWQKWIFEIHKSRLS